jgi:alginate O-acetyltransferase complex protein AlgI
MVFSSIVFLFYFLPAFLLAYYLTPKNYRNIIILVGSIFFYSWGAPRFIFVILATTLADFILVGQMHVAPSSSLKKFYLCLSLAMNLGLLFYFKYSNFFVNNLNTLFHSLSLPQLKWAKLILPIGISFYTFETVTYVVDVYRGIHKPLKKFWDYQLYIILFPKLIAGPIIRYHDIAGQIYDHIHHDHVENRLRGFYRFIIGLAKKVIIANVMAAQADAIFAIDPHNLSTLSAWVGALAYTFQIYFDFSGYSDMAIGLALMMGFRFPENFNNPYTSLSITEFWRRWHITLGAWMKNYLYIPLGGNRVDTSLRLYFNLWLVFLASGLWHGAAWGFIVWGAYHGSFLVIERLALLKPLQKLGKLSVIYTFISVLIGWVFFRLEHLTPALQFLKRMFGNFTNSQKILYPNEFLWMLCAAFIFAFFTLSKIGQSIQNKIYFAPYNNRSHIFMMVLSLVLLIICAGKITTSTFNPFIYFRF